MVETYRGTWVVAYRELLRFVQERSRLASSIGMPLLFLVIFGAGFSRVIGQLSPGVDFVQFMFPGILAMTVLMTSLFSGISVVWDREFGFLKEMLVAPMSRTGIVFGKSVGAIVVSLIQGMIVLVIAPFVGISLTPLMVLGLIPLVAVMAFALSSLGILIASRMRSQQGFQLLMQIIVMPMIFLSGVFFPVNETVVWLEVVAKVNPVTYGVDAIRQLFLGGELTAAAGSPIGVTVFGHTMGILEEVAIMAAMGLILMSIAVWSFGRQE